MNATLSLDAAASRHATPSQRTRTDEDRAALAELVSQAAEAQRDVHAGSLAAHLEAGRLAGSYILAEITGLSEKIDEAQLAAVDSIIDASFDGRSRNGRRQEIRRQVCLAALDGLISWQSPVPADSDEPATPLPLAHALCLIGAKIVAYDADRGQAIVDQDRLAIARECVRDYFTAPTNVATFRSSLAAALGKPRSNRKALADLLDDLRAVLADPDAPAERKRRILACHPELAPDYVDQGAITATLAAVGKLTAASRRAFMVKALTVMLTDDDARALLRAELFPSAE